MHDWSKMRETWRKARDSKKVPQGAGGKKINVGLALDTVGKVQKGGRILTLINALRNMDTMLAEYKKTMLKEHPKEQKYKDFASWIDTNLTKWIKEDRGTLKAEMAVLEKARASANTVRSTVDGMKPYDWVWGQAVAAAAEQGITGPLTGLTALAGLAVRPADKAAIEKAFKPFMDAMDDAGKLAAEAKKAYPPNSALPIVAALTTYEEAAEEYRNLAKTVPEKPTWADAGQVARTIGIWFEEGWGWYGAWNDIMMAIKARIGD